MQQRTRMRAAMAAMALTVVTASAVLATAPTGAAAPSEEHCVVRVVGQRPSGELRTTAPDCAPTRALALQRSGTTGADWVIGYHYDGQNLTGSSFTVVGDSCIGGWLNLPATWINRVSSTFHGCPHIRHFDGYDLVSPSQITVYPGGNLAATMNNKTNSIQYLG